MGNNRKARSEWVNVFYWYQLTRVVILDKGLLTAVVVAISRSFVCSLWHARSSLLWTPALRPYVGPMH